MSTGQPYLQPRPRATNTSWEPHPIKYMLSLHKVSISNPCSFDYSFSQTVASAPITRQRLATLTTLKKRGHKFNHTSVEPDTHEEVLWQVVPTMLTDATAVAVAPSRVLTFVVDPQSLHHLADETLARGVCATDCGLGETRSGHR